MSDRLIDLLIYGGMALLVVLCGYYLIGCASTGTTYVSHGGVVEAQRARDALNMQTQWEEMQRDHSH